MLLSDRIGPFRKRRRLLSVRRCFLDELFHPFENFVGAILGHNNRFSVFFADLNFCTRCNMKTFSYLLWENDSPL